MLTTEEGWLLNRHRMVKLFIRQTKMTLKLKTLIILIVMAIPLGGLLPIASVGAAEPATDLKPSDCPTSGVSKIGPNAGKACIKPASECLSGQVNPKVDDSVCVGVGNSCDQKTGICPTNPIVKDLNDIVKVLSGLVGVVVVGMIILGGIQYSMAGDKAEAVSAAKKRIINGVTALVAFLFIFAFLQWLIPGGIFK